MPDQTHVGATECLSLFFFFFPLGEFILGELRDPRGGGGEGGGGTRQADPRTVHLTRLVYEEWK